MLFRSIVFFTLLAVAAITSMVGLLEPQVAWLEEKYGYTRHKATLTMLGVVALLGVFSVLSYNIIAGWQIGSLNLNGILDQLSNKIMLPVGGLLIAIFAAWQIHSSSLREELPGMPVIIFSGWHFLIRFVLPISISVILITGLF